MNKTITLEGIGEIKMTRNNRIKRLAIAVRPFLGVRVKVPDNVSFKNAEKFVLEKRYWIKKNLDKVQRVEDQRLPFFSCSFALPTKVLGFYQLVCIL